MADPGEGALREGAQVDAVAVYVILWEFEARPGRVREFELAYGPDGDWARFFALGEGHLSSELLADPGPPLRYLTIASQLSR